MKIPAKVELHFRVATDADGLTATCDELPGLVTCAPDEQKLIRPMIFDAVIGWLDVMKERGQIGAVLSKLGADPESEEVYFSPILRHESDEIRYDLRASCG